MRIGEGSFLGDGKFHCIYLYCPLICYRINDHYPLITEDCLSLFECLSDRFQSFRVICLGNVVYHGFARDHGAFYVAHCTLFHTSSFFSLSLLSLLLMLICLQSLSLLLPSLYTCAATVHSKISVSLLLLLRSHTASYISFTRYRTASH